MMADGNRSPTYESDDEQKIDAGKQPEPVSNDATAKELSDLLLRSVSLPSLLPIFLLSSQLNGRSSQPRQRRMSPRSREARRHRRPHAQCRVSRVLRLFLLASRPRFLVDVGL